MGLIELKDKGFEKVVREALKMPEGELKTSLQEKIEAKKK